MKGTNSHNLQISNQSTNQPIKWDIERENDFPEDTELASVRCRTCMFWTLCSSFIFLNLRWCFPESKAYMVIVLFC